MRSRISPRSAVIATGSKDEAILIKIPPSQRMLDKQPSKPTNESSHQRIQPKTDRPALHLYLRIAASGEEIPTMGFGAMRDNQKNRMLSTISFGKGFVKEEGVEKKHCHEPYEWLPYFKGFNATRAHECVYGCSLKEIIQLGHLSLADFCPKKAPFIPEVINIFINQIENQCYATSWDFVLQDYPEIKEEAEEFFGYIIFYSRNSEVMRTLVCNINPELMVETLRVFLRAFKFKPMHFNRKTMKELIKRPLYDQFLRPNPDIKRLVQTAALHTSRTSLDTLSFLMVHLHHIWLAASDPAQARLDIGRIYGPALISFGERPVILEQPNPTKTEEAVLLEVVMETCEYKFWDHLSMLKVRHAFENVTDLEERQKVKLTRLYASYSEKAHQEPGRGGLAELDVRDFSHVGSADDSDWYTASIKIQQKRQFSSIASLSLKNYKFAHRIHRQEFLLDECNTRKKQAVPEARIKEWLQFLPQPLNPSDYSEFPRLSLKDIDTNTAVKKMLNSGLSVDHLCTKIQQQLAHLRLQNTTQRRIPEPFSLLSKSGLNLGLESILKINLRPFHSIQSHDAPI